MSLVLGDRVLQIISDIRPAHQLISRFLSLLLYSITYHREEAFTNDVSLCPATAARTTQSLRFILAQGKRRLAAPAPSNTLLVKST